MFLYVWNHGSIITPNSSDDDNDEGWGDAELDIEVDQSEDDQGQGDLDVTLETTSVNLVDNCLEKLLESDKIAAGLVAMLTKAHMIMFEFGAPASDPVGVLCWGSFLYCEGRSLVLTMGITSQLRGTLF